MTNEEKTYQQGYEEGYQDGVRFASNRIHEEYDNMRHFHDYFEGYTSIEVLKIRTNSKTTEEAQERYDTWKWKFRPNDAGKEVGESLPIASQAFRDPPADMAPAVQSQEDWYDVNMRDEEDF